MAWALDDGVAEEAVSIWTVLETDGDVPVALLPSWYQPAPMRRSHVLTGWRRRLAITTVIAFIAIDAFGLCSTYGYIEFA